VSVLAFDLGASSGRAVVGRLAGGKLSVEEIHRFPNDPVQAGGRLYWDILRLYHEVKQGLLKTKSLKGEPIESVGIDSWAVDFGLIGRNGELLANPYHYRDHHTDGVMERVFQLVPQAEIFARTGLQFLQFNTIYQLYAMKEAGSPLLDQAESLLMIPDLLRYFLTGEKKSEYTNASTTQLFLAKERRWDTELMDRLGLPKQIFIDPVEPGTIVGRLSRSVCEELDLPAYQVIAVAEHDTGSAVAAVPASDRDFAYLSCGTWSLLGTETDQPALGDDALALNFTNEGGVNRTYRLLKNIMGLWLIQECRRAWEKEGRSISYAELLSEAEQVRPFRSLIDPDDDQFLAPQHMPRQIREYCAATNQPAPETPGEFMRCIMESLALKYRYVLTSTEQLSGKRFSGLHMVGGGINNTMLCQFTANAIQRPVWAGPTEGSAIGNVVVQLMALGKIGSLQEARAIIRESFPIVTYEPQDPAPWSEAYDRFVKLTGLPA
jgi:rhamnulokinase